MIRWVFAVLLACACRSTFAADFVLVDEKVEPAPIIVFRDAPPLTRDAAVTLADYIEKISGARPAVLDGAPTPLPERAIWIGVQPEVAALFPGLDLEFKHPEEIVLAANEKHVLVAGRDRWDPDRLVVEAKRTTVNGKQFEYGTANAVFTFLQDQLGVRWLWPGELGEDVVKRRAIAVAPFTHRYYPRIRSRGGVLHYSNLKSIGGYGHSHDWTRKQRLQLHSMDMEGGHAFSDWWDRFHETHPEYFALQPDGSRGGATGYPSPGNVKLCHSNPAVAAQWLADVEESLKKDPTQILFNASPNDGWASGHCICEHCKAWDHPDGERRLFHWNQIHELHPALTDRDVTFANRCAKLLKERYPDKDYLVMMMSYGHSRPAPVKAVPAENVVMSCVANFLGRTRMIDDGSTTDTTYREEFEAWVKTGAKLMWRPNTGSPAGWQQGLPDVTLAQTMKDFQLLDEAGCLGIYIDGVWEHWSTHGPMYYLMAQLAWDPKQDGVAILDDYYARGFGPAADSIREYYEHFEAARMSYTNKNGYDGGMDNLIAIYTPEMLDVAEKHLQAAKAAVAGNELFTKRVEFVGAGLTYTQLVMDNARRMSVYWETKDSAAEAAVRKNWEVLEQLCKDHPYAINWGPVRPITPRMPGLHPDFPVTKNKKKSRVKAANDLDLN